MLGTAHIAMIRLMLYRALPHREGGGGPGNVTQPRAELRRQLRAIRNVHLLGHLVRTAANLPVDPEVAARLRHYRLPDWTSGRASPPIPRRRRTPHPCRSEAQRKACLELLERDRQFRIARPGRSERPKEANLRE